MTSSTTTVAARKRFDQAMALFDTDTPAAQARFREATELDPSMADRSAGRIAAGDDEAVDAAGALRLRRAAAPGDQSTRCSSLQPRLRPGRTYQSR